MAGFPIGATVYVDGHDVHRVLEHYPEGSTSYLFPHYRLTKGRWLPEEHMFVGQFVYVHESRVGVKKR